MFYRINAVYTKCELKLFTGSRPLLKKEGGLERKRVVCACMVKMFYCINVVYTKCEFKLPIVG